MNTIKPETIRILRHDTLETNSVFIVDLNATLTLKRFCKSHDRLSKTTTGNWCRGRWTLKNLMNLDLRDPNMLTIDC